MGNRNVIRRSGALALGSRSSAARDAMGMHRGDGISVERRLSTGLEPSVALTWTIDPGYVRDGYTLMIFRSSSGLSPKPYTDDLSAHGTLVAETAADGSHTDRLPEGTYYYTFLLRRTVFFGLIEQASAVRFSVDIPSAKVGIGRIKDQMELRDLANRQESGVFDYESKLNEAELRLIESRRALERAKGTKASSDPIIANQIGIADALLEVTCAKDAYLKKLRKNKKFRSLPKDVQRDMIQEIESQLDHGEISARREMHKS